ncbi:hypothetical protein [uncultured Kocuria sp.]|uniref:hypothetical protein n=1 Tax=uncultured Kocuria sp. TaxID=259305 RepID=UPI00260F873B|nr:hypothetical protein [uncultured Kocuria sp.]
MNGLLPHAAGTARVVVGHHPDGLSDPGRGPEAVPMVRTVLCGSSSGLEVVQDRCSARSRCSSSASAGSAGSGRANRTWWEG